MQHTKVPSMANYDARNVQTPESRSKRSISREE